VNSHASVTASSLKFVYAMFVSNLKGFSSLFIYLRLVNKFVKMKISIDEAMKKSVH